MGTKTKIEWCDHTFNPWIGCEKISAGCTHCYAADLATRFFPGTWGGDGERKPVSRERWNDVLSWDRVAQRNGSPALVFCGSMCDVFEDHDSAFVVSERHRLFCVIEATPHLMWLLLTKRPENIEDFVPGGSRYESPNPFHRDWLMSPPPHVMYLTSIEDQASADERIPQLLATPAWLRGLSVEPLLEFVNLHLPKSGMSLPLRIVPKQTRGHYLDWIIVGGESGPKARQCSLFDIYGVMQQAREFGIPTFVKQLGSAPRESRDGTAVILHDAKGGDPSEWPECYRVRDFPFKFHRWSRPAALR